jgi:hypothetical protein
MATKEKRGTDTLPTANTAAPALLRVPLLRSSALRQKRGALVEVGDVIASIMPDHCQDCK